MSCGVVNASDRPQPDVPAPRVETGSGTPSAMAAPGGAGTSPAPTPQEAPPPRPVDAAVIQKAAATVEPNTIVGALVIDRVASATPLAINPERQFRSASLVKLLIAITVLRAGADAQDRDRVARMLAASDDDIASAYWVDFGGPNIVLRTSAEIGLTATRPPENPGQWGEVLITPSDMARIYQYILTMPAPARTLLIDSLAQAPRFADDGFDQHFGIPDGFRTAWAVKQGWGNNSSAMVLHSTGLAGPDWRYIVVLLTEHPLGSGWRRSAQSVTAAAATLERELPRAG